MKEEELFRTKELESFFERYPDVPKEVIVKEDALRYGVRFSQAALERASAGRPRSYYIFSYDKTEVDADSPLFIHDSFSQYKKNYKFPITAHT